MKKMRLLVLSVLVFSGANAQNLNLDTWSNSTTATGWTSPLNGYELLVSGEDAPVNQATGSSGSGARLNPIDLTTVGFPVVVSLFGIGPDADSDLSPDGIPYTTRVESVDFQMKYTLAGDAVGIVEIYMINGADTIGEGLANYTMNVSNYQGENIVIDYDPAFDGVDPTTLSIAVAVAGSDPTSTDADFYVDQFVVNDVDNTSLNELNGDLWKVSTVNNAIVVSGVESGDVVIYNTNGQILGSASVVNGIASVDATNASGLVVVQLTSGNESGIKKVVLIK